MRQMQLPFKGMEGALADELRAKQFELKGQYLYSRLQLIKDIKGVGLNGWHLDTNSYSAEYGYILHKGENICGRY